MRKVISAPLATWEDIKTWRDLHEEAPVQTSLGLFDVDARSTSRMQEAIDAFDHLPTLEDKKLRWKLADNTFVLLSESDLSEIFNEVRVERASRGALLHVKGEEFRQAEYPIRVVDLADIVFWLGPFHVE